jgi:predicted SPOUT superfamily RNA methylase MTH1
LQAVEPVHAALQVAGPQEPRQQHSMYWGYSTRIAKGVQGLLKGCPYKGGYDLKIGTSEHGATTPSESFKVPHFRHLLVAFGGLNGLEECIEHDSSYAQSSPDKVFDVYLNTCPNQGSRTIRTEEAVLISMSFLQPAIAACQGVDASK